MTDNKILKNINKKLPNSFGDNNKRDRFSDSELQKCEKNHTTKTSIEKQVRSWNVHLPQAKIKSTLRARIICKSIFCYTLVIFNKN